MSASPTSLEIDSKTAASLIGVTPRRLRQLSDDGWFQPVGRNKWPLVKVVSGYIQCIKDEASRSSKSAAASRVTDARTREIELRIARQEGNLMDFEDVQSCFDELAGTFITSFESLPARLTRNPRERNRIQIILDNERSRISKKMNDLARKANIVRA